MMEQRPRILVVDDETGPRESIRMILKPHFEVLTVEGGQAALRELPRFRPDVVFMDIKMPTLDGVEVLRRIKTHDPSIEVVMITAYASLDTVKRALTHGALEYLIKPFSRKDLEETVGRALARRQSEFGRQGEVARLAQEMRALAAKTRELEEAARREVAEQSLRVAQLSILREISRGILGQLDLTQMTASIRESLQVGLGYDDVTIHLGGGPPPADEGQTSVTCPIREAGKVLGHLRVNNRGSGRPIDPRERELLEMLSEYLAIAVHNITTQREIEAQMLQSEKLTALGQLAGGIAHDFNNLLQAILGYAQIMARNPQDTELVKRGLGIIGRAATDGSETVRRIQEFARLRPDEAFIALDLNQVIREAVAITRPRWEERAARGGIRLELDLDLSSVPPVLGRPAALSEVMTNLILNAIDAMPLGGSLRIATRAEGTEWVSVDVADTGVGMSDEVRRRIFDPFFTTKGEAGTGLGLSVSYSIMKRHGGEIRLESQVGHGTTFTLRLPARTVAEPEAPRPADQEPQHRARILLIDNEPQVLVVLSEMLAGAGHTVTPAGNGLDAVEVYAPGKFDLVLSNIGMPGINGWQVVERVRAVDPQVPVIFVTGWGLTEDDRERCRALGIRHWLFKPVQPSELHRTVQDALVPR